jgi:hypothetical protein
MKLTAIITYGVLFLALALAGCSGGGDDAGGNSGDGNTDQGLRMGLLQFRTQHTLADNSCLPNNCDLTMEDETDTTAWLDELAAISNMAVLHWDRPIPWLAFDANPPTGTSRVSFYDGRIDTSLLNWINAFVSHFHRMPTSYLAVSLLNGLRDGLQKCRVDDTLEVDVTSSCPVLSPGTQIAFQYDPGTGTVNESFDLARAYTNFIMYLYDKLQPDYLALMVEVNLFKNIGGTCSTNWTGLAQLYHYIYDTVRPQVATQTKVFATLQLLALLDYNNTTCHGALSFEACTGTVSPPAFGVPDPAVCYPLDLSAITDLDQGNRLEILALSFYPDALLMDVAADNLIKLYPENWDGVADCDYRAQAPPFLDPVEALDRFNWTKPIAIAELGARGGRTLQFDGGYLVQPPGDLTSQNFWLDHWLTAAKARNFEFYVNSFSDDFVPIGPWVVPANIMDRNLYSQLNNFVYMGIYDDQGFSKAGVTQTWLDALP